MHSNHELFHHPDDATTLKSYYNINARIDELDGILDAIVDVPDLIPAEVLADTCVASTGNDCGAEPAHISLPPVRDKLFEIEVRLRKLEAFNPNPDTNPNPKAHLNFPSLDSVSLEKGQVSSWNSRLLIVRQGIVKDARNVAYFKYVLFGAYTLFISFVSYACFGRYLLQGVLLLLSSETSI